MKFGQLIFRKVIQIVATRCHFLILKMHQIRFRLRLRPRPRWGSLQRSPDPLAGFKGSTSKGKGEQERGKEGGRKGREEGKREGKGKERKRGGECTPKDLVK